VACGRVQETPLRSAPGSAGRRALSGSGGPRGRGFPPENPRPGRADSSTSRDAFHNSPALKRRSRRLGAVLIYRRHMGLGALPAWKRKFEVKIRILIPASGPGGGVMDQYRDWQELLRSSYDEFVTTLGAFLPGLLRAAILMLAGMLLAW